MSSTEEPRSATPAAVESERGALRASDGEREATVAVLHRALGEGRLDLAETDERVSAAYTARYCDELPRLLADLPAARATGSSGPSWSELWISLVWRARLFVCGDASQVAPTPRQQQIAALIAGLALAWMLVCAVAGAALVGS
jgi:hypothetical protein